MLALADSTALSRGELIGSNRRLSSRGEWDLPRIANSVTGGRIDRFGVRIVGFRGEAGGSELFLDRISIKNIERRGNILDSIDNDGVSV